MTDFPHDPNTPHAIDRLPSGTIVTKDSPTTIAQHGHVGVDGMSIPPDDVLQHLPEGTMILLGEPGTPTAVLVSLPPAEDREAPVHGFGHRLHEAVGNIWRYL